MTMAFLCITTTTVQVCFAARALMHQAESRSPAHGRHYCICVCVWACRRCRACQL